MTRSRNLLLFLAFGFYLMVGCDSATKSKDNNEAPNLPSSPSPSDGATNVDIDPTFSWTGGDADGDVVTYIFLVLDDFGNGFEGTTTNETIGLGGSLDYSTHYQWQIQATDGKADTVNGPIWDFTTEENAPVLFVSPSSMNFGTSATALAITVSNNGGGTFFWTATDNQAWLSLAPSSGSATNSSPDLINVTVNRSGLSAGSYSGTVTISETGTGAQSVNVSVVMEVAPVTIFDHTFESSSGIIPGSVWNAVDNDGGSGVDTWGDQQTPTARVHGGSWSAYSADNSDVSGQFYDNNMDAWLWNDFTAIDISGYSNVEISFWMWYNTEFNFDFLRFLYWTGSTWVQFSGGSWSGNQSQWTQYTFDVPAAASNQFQFAWQFDTDASVTAEGVYIDDIVITGTANEPGPQPSAHHESEKTLQSVEQLILAQPTEEKQFRTE